MQCTARQCNARQCNLCMYVCMYVCMHVHLHIYIYTYIHICIYTHDRGISHVFFVGHLVEIHSVNRMWSIGRQCGDIMIPLQRNCSNWMLGCSNLVCSSMSLACLPILAWDDRMIYVVSPSYLPMMELYLNLKISDPFAVWESEAYPKISSPQQYQASGRSLTACAIADAWCPCGDHPPIPITPRRSHPKRGFRQRGPAFLMISFSPFSFIFMNLENLQSSRQADKTVLIRLIKSTMDKETLWRSEVVHHAQGSNLDPTWRVWTSQRHLYSHQEPPNILTHHHFSQKQWPFCWAQNSWGLWLSFAPGR